MKFDNRETGIIGEGMALEYLLKNGFELITRNFSTRFGEIDLIMRDKDILVFVEVKTKKGLSWGSPEEMFTQGKLNRVRRMATVYLQGKEVPCRIDMVAIVLDSANCQIALKHYTNVS
jgi:putative endonuclease